MSLLLRDKLRLSASCGERELREVCNRYYRIYKDVEESATDPYVKKIARAKLDDLLASAAKEGITVNGAEEYNVTHGSTVSTWDIESQFSNISLYEGVLSPSQVTKYSEMISRLPESPKKHYLQFLLEKNSIVLTNENIEGLQRYIQRAIEGDPENPVYNRILDDLEEAVRVYEEKLREWERKKQKEIADKARIEKTKRALKFIGTGSFKLLALAATAAAAFLGCLFECICNDC